jgi:uncharacterized protein (TIGR00369 family)
LIGRVRPGTLAANLPRAPSLIDLLFLRMLVRAPRLPALRYDNEETTMSMDPLPFSKLMGLTIVSVAPDCVKAELPVREDLCTRPAVLHGGAVMAFADTLGALATIANLPGGAGTTTIESKTNFFAAISLGDTAKAECTPLHRGRTTMVWQTRITRGDGRLAAIVTQTQLVLAAK